MFSFHIRVLATRNTNGTFTVTQLLARKPKLIFLTIKQNEKVNIN